MKNILNLFLGIFAGVLVAFLFGVLIFYWFTGVNILEKSVLISSDLFASKALILGAIPNIGLFYIFLNKQNYFAARGIIISFVVLTLYAFLIS